MRKILLLASLALVTGCRVVVDVPPGGAVAYGSGGACPAASACVIEVSNTDFDDTFRAVPEPGWRFAGWQKRPSGLFGNSNKEEVRLATGGFVDNPALLAFLDSDATFFLQPVFEPLDNQAGKVVLSGRARYQRPAERLRCRSLDFDNVSEQPIRGATVQALSASREVLAQSQTDSDGNYRLLVPAATEVFLRVRSELKKGGDAGWNVEVRDNARGVDKPLDQRPIYRLESATFDTGSSNLRRNILATTGWTGDGYGGPRAASPFAVLDTVYAVMQAALAADATINFPELDLYWSDRNSTAVGDLDLGEVGGAFYWDGDIFLSGLEGDDDDAFDASVIAHEWFHYATDTMGSDASPGGFHALGDVLDMRLAFSEGAATAMAGMALERNTYCDTAWVFGQLGTYVYANLELEYSGLEPGFHNEASIIKAMYDLWDKPAADDDTLSIDYGHIYKSLIEDMAQLPSLTSIFGFVDSLKQRLPMQAEAIEALLREESIETAGVDHWGDGAEDPFPGGNTPDLLPLHRQVVGQGPVELCVNRQFDLDNYGNRLTQRQFLRFDVPTRTRVAIRAEDPLSSASRRTDPDLLLYRNSALVAESFSIARGVEAFEPRLDPGTYVLEVLEYGFLDPDIGEDLPSRICFQVTVDN